MKGLVMAAKRLRSFDTKSFLARVAVGRSIGKYRKGQVVFSQGDTADAVFYIQKGKAKLTVVSGQGSGYRNSWCRRILRRGMSCRAVAAYRDGHEHDGRRHRSIGKISYYPGDPSGTGILGAVHRPSAGPEHPRRSRPGRSVVQFE